MTFYEVMKIGSLLTKVDLMVVTSQLVQDPRFVKKLQVLGRIESIGELSDDF